MVKDGFRGNYLWLTWVDWNNVAHIIGTDNRRIFELGILFVIANGSGQTNFAVEVVLKVRGINSWITKKRRTDFITKSINDCRYGSGWKRIAMDFEPS